MVKKITKMFIGIEIIIFIIFMYLDIFHQALYNFSNYFKFFGIMLCAMYVILSFRYRGKSLDRWLLLFAILFTLVSDWFILIRHCYNYGVITFIIVQYLYLIRMHYQYKNVTITFFLRKLFVNLIIVGCITPILLFVHVEVDILVLLSLFYFVTFIMNVLQGIYQFQKEKDATFLLFLVGIIMFLLCDINVVIFNISTYVSIKENWFITIEKFSRVGMWMFYLPSQVLISLSSLSKESKEL